MSGPGDARSVAAAPDWQVWLGLTTVYLVWGSTYLAIRVMVRTVPPLLGAGARFLLAGALLYGFLLVRGGFARVRANRRQLAGAALIGVLLPAGGNGLVTVAERDVPSSLAALLVASVPLWVILFRRLTGDRIARPTRVGVGIGFVGVAILLLPGNRPEGATAVGLLLVVIAAASWASGSFLSPRLAQPADPLVSTALQMLMGGMALTIAAAVGGEFGDVHPSEFNLGSAWSFTYLVTIGSVVAFSAYVWLLRHAPISKVATYAYVNPVVAVLLGWSILGEDISAVTLAGATVIVASVAAVVRTESAGRAPGHAQRAEELAPARQPSRV